MSNKINGYREETLKGLTTGAAVAFEDFDLATDTYETGKKMGTTSGGVKVTIEYPDAWDRELDGVPANSVGMRENEFMRPTVTLTLAEVSNTSTLKRALSGATVGAAQKPTGYQVVKPVNDVRTEDYLENITLFTQTKGTKDPLIIVLERPLSTEGFEFATEAKAGGVIEVTFTGNYDPANLDEVPIKFYVPAPSA